MAFVRFKRSNGTDAWVASQFVTAVTSYGTGSNIFLQDELPLPVSERPEEVVDRLNAAEAKAALGEG